MPSAELSAEGDTGEETRLTAVCTDGTRLECANFKAIDSGVLLTEDVKRKRVLGFVPNDRLRYVLPTEVVRGADEDEQPTFEDELMELPRLGETYAKRLRSAGYTSMSELAAATIDDLVSATGARESVVGEWREQASKRTESGETEAGTDEE